MYFSVWVLVIRSRLVVTCKKKFECTIKEIICTKRGYKNKGSYGQVESRIYQTIVLEKQQVVLPLALIIHVHISRAENCSSYQFESKLNMNS